METHIYCCRVGVLSYPKYHTFSVKMELMMDTAKSSYLLNPYTLLTCLGRPTTVFTTFFVFLSINHARQAKMLTSAFALAIATYMSLHPLFLLPPIGMLCYDRLCLEQSTPHTNGSREESRGNKSTGNTPPKSAKIAVNQTAFPSALPFALKLLATYTLILALLLLLSRTFLPTWSFVSSVYLTPLTLPDLTPNSGLWWYFFTEMFDAFRSFFLGVFWLHMLSYSVPFCLRLSKQAGGALGAVVCMMGIIAVFQPYANGGDAGAWLSAACLLSHVFESTSSPGLSHSFRSPFPTHHIQPPTNSNILRTVSTTHRYTFPALSALLYCTLLAPAFHHLWIYAGSGNANFFYAITLVWNLGLLILETDLLYAVLRDEWERGRPEGVGREVRQI